jgi:hypothetical protein
VGVYGSIGGRATRNCSGHAGTTVPGWTAFGLLGLEERRSRKESEIAEQEAVFKIKLK